MDNWHFLGIASREQERKKAFFIYFHMYKGFLLTALRGLRRSKRFSIINIGGLAFGMACTILILMWGKDELRVEGNYANKYPHYAVQSLNQARPVGRSMQKVQIFTLGAAIILLVACVNFMNMSLTRSERRKKEMGIQGISVASRRRPLIGQLWGELFLISFFAGGLSLGLVQTSLPLVNRLTSKQMRVEYGNGDFWIYFFGFIFLTTLMAAIYPAIFSSYPSSFLKQKRHERIRESNLTKRKYLLGLTFWVLTLLYAFHLNLAVQ
jgi:hypothetical protein